MIKNKVLGNDTKIPNSPLGYKFDKIKNNNFKLNYNIRITVPEFTSICPVTSQPDFGLFIIDYEPKNYLVESKSFKLFIQSFRNFGIFHEDASLLIGKNLKKDIKPKWIRVAGYFAPRGGIPIDVFWQSSKCPSNIFIPDLGQNINMYNRQ